MKKIEAIIRNSQFEKVRKALLGLDIDFFSYSEVSGIGSEKSSGKHFRLNATDKSILPRVSISFTCADGIVKEAVKLIMESAGQTEMGDGRIIISTIDELVYIKTTEVKSTQN